MSETEVFKLDLDASEFIEGIGKSSEKLEELGIVSKDSLKELIKGIGEATALLGLMAIAFLAVKSAISWVEQAEQIKMVNQQFELLTEGAGIAGETLKKGLVDASKGLIDETELLKLANKAIVEMGDNASKLPEIMELARKVTATFGGELSTNFENLNQAIATGQTRLLKHMGIVVDVNKAQIAYAQSIGTTVGALSESGKQAATLNAVLEKGATAFKGVSSEGLQTKNSMQEIKVAATELGEIFVNAFDKVMGPVVRAVTHDLANFAHALKKAFGTDESTDIEKTTKEIQDLEKQISSTKFKLLENQNDNPILRLFLGSKDEIKAKVDTQVAALTAKLEAAKAKLEKLKESAEPAKGGASPVDVKGKVDDTKRLAQENEFNKELIKLKDEVLKEEIKNERSIEEVEKHAAQEKLQAEKDSAQQIQAVKQKLREGKITPQQEAQLEIQINMQKNQKLISLDEDLTARKIKALQNFSIHSDKASAQFAAGWKSNSLKAEQSLHNFANIGGKSFDIVGSQASKAFQDLGSGAKSGADVMKGFILGSIGDMAKAQGEYLLLAGIGTYNPVMVAEGGALLALSGLLSAASGSSSSLGSSSGGSVSSNGGAPPGAVDSSLPAAQTSGPGQTVTLQVMGSIYETEETKQRLLDLIRSETDATAFKYQQIGV